MQRHTVHTGGPWESEVGYARAVRVGQHVFVSGTTAIDASGQLVGDAYQQTRQALANIETGLQKAGATLQDVVRTRIFVVNIKADAEAVSQAHKEVFGRIRPAATMVEVVRLIDPRMLV